MSEQYRFNVRAKDDAKIGDWLKPQGLGAVMERVRDRTKLWKGPYSQGNRDQDWGTPRKDRMEACDHFRDALAHNETGDTRVMQDLNRGSKLFVKKVHVIDVDYPNVSSNATSRAKAIIKPLWDAFPQLDYYGTYNCRRISGSSSWSEHAWADADDIGPPTMAYGDQVYRWLMQNKGRFDITRVLWRVAGHYDHLHIDFDPDHSGTPPCA